MRNCGPLVRNARIMHTLLISCLPSKRNSFHTCVATTCFRFETVVTRKMSFKRDGDNVDLFGIAMKHRVSELLLEDIPEEDALLMKNGKLACSVCSHRPVFDTVNMLALHRKGKRHLACEEYRQQQREEVMVLAMKRNQLEYLQPVSSSKNQLGGQWKKAKPYDRKRRLDLASSVCSASLEATASCSLPGFSAAGLSSMRRQPAAKPGQPCRSGSSSQPHTGSQHWPFAPHLDVHTSEKTTVPEEPAAQRAHDVTTDRPRTELVHKYLQARGGGWKKDLLGNWVKDEDAEFDSDEEPPDLP